jgi:FkbM family methyltransferase
VEDEVLIHLPGKLFKGLPKSKESRSKLRGDNQRVIHENALPECMPLGGIDVIPLYGGKVWAPKQHAVCPGSDDPVILAAVCLEDFVGATHGRIHRDAIPNPIGPVGGLEVQNGLRRERDRGMGLDPGQRKLVGAKGRIHTNRFGGVELFEPLQIGRGRSRGFVGFNVSPEMGEHIHVIAVQKTRLEGLIGESVYAPGLSAKQKCHLQTGHLYIGSSFLYMPNPYTSLTAVGWSPRAILDIGGFKGNWTREVQGLFPSASVVILEPNAHPELRSIGVPVFHDVVSSSVREVPWYSNLSTGDSLYQERTSHYVGVTPVTRTTTTLDTLFPTRRFDFVKIDCQGSELDILEGGQTLVAETEVLLLECSFAGQYNRGAPSFADYIRVTDALGFAPVDITELHRANGVLCQIDILFLRKTSPLWSRIQTKLTT